MRKHWLTSAVCWTGLSIALLTGLKAEAPGPLSESEVHRRTEALLRQMTPEEKIGQMCQVFLLGKPNATLDERLRKGGLGSLLFVSDPVLANRLQRVAVEESRLHIPLLFGFDVIHGLRTIFPVPIAMAASWDPAMVERAQGVAAKEARAVGIHWSFAPMVDIARDPRWGRIVEGAGEDPFLGAAMAAAQVRGFQGPFLGAPDHVVACAKHFAGYGAAEGGRDYDSVELSDSQLWNVYLPPFKRAAEVGAGSFMSAYMDLNGVPATGSRWLMKDVLRTEWNFQGFVVSDADAVNSLKVHGYAADRSEAALRAAQAGVNMEMALFKTAYGEHLPQAVQEGKLSATELDALVRPILETKLRLGLFEHPYADEGRAAQVLHVPEHRQESQRAAERSAVLLRNEGGLLPLKASAYPRIAVIGPLADSKTDVAGPWSFVNNPEESITVLEGLKQEFQNVAWTHAPGVQIARKFPSIMDGAVKEKKQAPWTEAEAKQALDQAVQVARDSDLVLMVLGERQNMAGEAASRSSLELPGEQQHLLEAAVATGKPVVLVLMSARPLDLVWASAHVPAILDVWYPGSEGGSAVANLLFGKAVPGGKLPYTWPRNVGQVPIFYAHTTTHDPKLQGKRYWNEESTPLYPFGFGLSYSNFTFSNLQVEPTSVKKGESLRVSVEVQNTGSLKADEVAQLYLHQQAGTSSRPVRELKGFQRVTLAPGEKTTVRFNLGKEELSYWSSATRGWVQDAAAFDVWVGADATATLQGGFTVTP